MDSGKEASRIATEIVGVFLGDESVSRVEVARRPSPFADSVMYSVTVYGLPEGSPGYRLTYDSKSMFLIGDPISTALLILEQLRESARGGSN